MIRKQKVKILLVDDKVGNLIVLENILLKKDREFLKANNGEEALKLALLHDLDLIILDVQMPGMDGFEVVQFLKAKKKTRDVPIIFATAERKEQQFILRGIEEGAVDYLFKPLDPAVTAAKVDLLLKLHFQKKELMEKNEILEKYALLINNCTDLICTISADTLRFEEINKAFETMLGFDQDHFKSNSLLFYLSDEDRLKVNKLKEKSSTAFDFECRMYCSDRHIKWIHWQVVKKGDRWFANGRDVTEKKQVEEVKSYLSTVVKQSDDAIYLHDTNGKIVSWNKGAEKIYGYTEEQALNMLVWNIIPPDFLQEANDVLSRILEEKVVPVRETKRINRAGKIIDVISSCSLVVDSNNTVRSIAITERDITEQKVSDLQIRELNVKLNRNVDQLETMNKELESFSYSVSHDLRAPLRAIAAYSKIIEEENGKELSAEPLRLFRNIESNAKRMGVLIDDLLEFSRLGRKEIRKADVDMKELSQHCINECNSSVTHSAKIVVGELPSPKADYGLISQVLVNLVSNGIKYSSKKKQPVIEIGGYEENEEHVFFVKDNGAGFNMKYAEKLFGVFQRLHADNEFEGTGVGLAIVKRIISKHGGRVWAEAKEKEGATFYFTLPK